MGGLRVSMPMRVDRRCRGNLRDRNGYVTDSDPAETKRVRIALFNVKYSQNLGDGLLTECLERELAATSEAETFSLDLAGRLQYDGGVRDRRTAMAILERLPGALRRQLVAAVLTPTLRGSLRPMWRAALACADEIVVGGGHLLTDFDLNFPLKINAALLEAAAFHLPIAIFGVGVSDDWSVRGTRLFEEGFQSQRLVHVAVRDEGSRRAWLRHAIAPTAPEPVLCFDPGILAARYFPAAQGGPGAPIVALGLTDPLALHYHSASTRLREDEYVSWLAELAGRFVQNGWQTRLFTNGSQEDKLFLARAAPRLTAAGAGKVSVAPPFERTSDLAAFVAASDLVVAHRLHACVAAYAFARPHVGFAWDPKLEAFFDATGRSDFVVRPCVTSPGDTAAAAARWRCATGLTPPSTRA